MDHIRRNYVLCWLNSNINELDYIYEKVNSRLRHTVGSISVFDESDDFVDFITELQEKKSFLIISCVLCQYVVPLIQDIPQLVHIYVFCNHEKQHEGEWTRQFQKVHGVFNTIELMCNTLEQDIRQREFDMKSINVLSSSNGTNELDQSFMYTQLLKEILVKMDYDSCKAKKDLVTFLKLQYIDNNRMLEVLDEFERDYSLHSPIW
ncbi:hypothetical protein I4U23_004046 [Adineta vaga]|nr:hypothetical protein I4U23_004046 [Adineta vaga]